MAPRPTVLSAARILLPEGLLGPGWVALKDGVILETGLGAPPTGAHDLGSHLLGPGFVDVHAHGGGGVSFMEGRPAATTALAAHRNRGTTSMMASLVTDTIDNLECQITTLAPLVASGDLLGIHLEGPWLADEYCGAHDPALLCDPRPADVHRLMTAGRGTVRMVTLAPERSGALEAIALVRQYGALAAVGHTGADHTTTRSALDSGATVATHLFNAMSPIHHRHPGPAPALLEDSRATVELIADGAHIHPSVLAMATRAAPQRFILVTDAMAAAGAPDGTYLLGPLDVDVSEGLATIHATTTIAGSTLTLDRAVRFMANTVHLSLETALQAATIRPADLLGRTDIGRLAPGAQANLVALDQNLHVSAVWHHGQRVDHNTLTTM